MADVVCETCAYWQPKVGGAQSYGFPGEWCGEHGVVEQARQPAATGECRGYPWRCHRSLAQVDQQQAERPAELRERLPASEIGT